MGGLALAQQGLQPQDVQALVQVAAAATAVIGQRLWTVIGRFALVALPVRDLGRELHLELLAVFLHARTHAHALLISFFFLICFIHVCMYQHQHQYWYQN